jgi:hypothetical protein
MGFWRVTERTAPHFGHGVYDGVLVSVGGAAVVVLKDRHVGRARNYMLWPQREGLYGRGVSQAVRFSGSNAGSTSELETVSMSLSKRQ